MVNQAVNGAALLPGTDMVEIEHKRIGFAAIDTWVRAQIFQGALRQFAPARV